MSDETIGTPAVPETPREPVRPASASDTGGTSAPNPPPVDRQHSASDSSALMPDRLS